MTITNEIKKKIREKGGAVQNVKDIASGVKALNTNSVMFVKVVLDESEGATPGTFVSDKTAKEVYDAYKSGIMCFATVLGGILCSLQTAQKSGETYTAVFQGINIIESSGNVTVSSVSAGLMLASDTPSVVSVNQRSYSGLTAIS